MKIIVLYTRLPGYWMACMRAFVQKYGGEFIVITQKENPNAPFKFKDEEGIKIFNFDEFDQSSLLRFCISEKPDLIYVTGWTEKTYLAVAKHFRSKNIPIICGGVDNKWENTLRQNVGSLYFKVFLKKFFTHIWIPGEPQKELAHRLGFSSNQILEGLYSADLDLFKTRRPEDESEIYKRFVFVGRYVDEKGLKELWRAFVEFYEEFDPRWELWCFGDGPLMAKAPKHPHIQHHGFTQPDKLRLLATPGVFILPSRDEHWGVVMHEFAAAGFPIISSKEVGAASAFLKEEENGLSFEASNYLDLKRCMKAIAQKTDDERLEMGRRSMDLAENINPESWSDTLAKVSKSKYE